MALTDYKAVYSKNGKLANDAMLRAAEIYDKQENVAEAKKLFTKLYDYEIGRASCRERV